MAVIKLRRGDLFEEPDDVVKVVTVNCKGIMGAGIALTCKQRYPEIFERYRSQCQRGLWKPGMVATMVANNGDMLLLAATKDEWRFNSRYEWVESCLERIAVVIERYNIDTIALSHLGCGNGKLDPDRVRKMTDDLLGHCLVDIHLYF